MLGLSKKIDQVGIVFFRVCVPNYSFLLSEIGSLKQKVNGLLPKGREEWHEVA